MSVQLTSKRVYAALAAVQVGDAVACAIPVPPIKKALDDVGLAEDLRPVLPIVKAASAIGLLSVYRFPGLARLTTLMLTVYMALAVSFHVRAKDLECRAGRGDDVARAVGDDDGEGALGYVVTAGSASRSVSWSEA